MKRKIFPLKWTLWMCLFCLWSVFSEMVHGQETQSDSVKNDFFIKKGSMALVFQINENFTLSDFQGALISMKWHFSIRSAIRFGFNFEGDYSKTNDKEYISEIDSNVFQYSFVETNLNYGIAIQYIWHSVRNKGIMIYFAAGPTFNYHPYHEYRSDIKRPSKVTPYQYYIGITTGVGVEMIVFKNVSFIAEYGLTALYRYKNLGEYYDDWGTYLSQGVIDSFECYPNKIKFGISFYFR